MTARFEMWQRKGFDAVEPDNMDRYENNSGFPITAAQQLAYDAWIAQEVHSLGMSVCQKNDPDQAAPLEPYFDGVIDEQCNQYSECSSYQPYLNAGKPVLNAEYEASLYPSLCAGDQAAGMMGALYATALDGSVYHPCFGPSPPLPPTSSSSNTGTGTPGRNSASRVRIRSVVATARRVAIKLTCASRQSFCAGTVELAAVARALRAHRRRLRIPLVLGEKHFRIPVDRSKLILVKLRRKALKPAVCEEIDQDRRHGDRHGRRRRGGSRSAEGEADTPIAGELTASSRQRRRPVLDDPHAVLRR